MPDAWHLGQVLIASGLFYLAINRPAEAKHWIFNWVQALQIFSAISLVYFASRI